jgi:hypothetical protein
VGRPRIPAGAGICLPAGDRKTSKGYANSPAMESMKREAVSIAERAFSAVIGGEVAATP